MTHGPAMLQPARLAPRVCTLVLLIYYEVGLFCNKCGLILMRPLRLVRSPVERSRVVSDCPMEPMLEVVSCLDPTHSSLGKGVVRVPPPWFSWSKRDLQSTANQRHVRSPRTFVGGAPYDDRSWYDVFRTYFVIVYSYFVTNGLSLSLILCTSWRSGNGTNVWDQFYFYILEMIS